MGLLCISSYRPLPGQEAAFTALLREHGPALKAAGLITDFPLVTGRAADGTILEIFEWKNEAAMEAAHDHPGVLAVWGRFEGLCEFRTLRDLSETARPFANFEMLQP